MNSISITSDLAAGREALLAGDPPRALAILERLVAAAPAEIEPRYWLASARLTARDPQAAAAMDDARILHALAQAQAMGADIQRCQTDPGYAADIAARLYAQKLVAMSGVVRGMALSAGMEVSGLLSYGLALQHQGRADEACEVFRAAADSLPSASVHQFLIYPQLFRDGGDARHFAAAREWTAAYARGAPAAPHANPGRAGRRLSIGYVAPRFAGSQLMQFIAPLLENHDPQAVSVTLYPTDAGTEANWPSWIKVHPLGGLDDAQAAALIRRDGIDVLADCWGHTAGSRLPVFAHRPAPVQVAWINFVQTTGLDQMDYVLHADTDATPDGMAEVFTEQIWPIGPVFNAFRPAAGRLAPVPTPALKSGQVTFGSFNHPAKLSDSALDAWAAVLRGAPTSRLLLKYGYFADPVLQRVTQARFAARGVAPDRVVFAGHSTGEAYFQAFREVDLMLDAWPAPGSTTTLDALSNGVPVLAKPTPTSGGLCVRAILEACGLPELIASSAEDFVAQAIDLVLDTERLDALRARVRSGFDNGACADEAGFTRRVETAFGGMFDLWLSGSRGDRVHG
jgi:predicted O-linked N-acetylglucosamine transferase (SPINDLY family)